MTDIFDDLSLQDVIDDFIDHKPRQALWEFFGTDLVVGPLLAAIRRAPPATRPPKTVILLPGILGTNLLDQAATPRPARLWLNLSDPDSLGRLRMIPSKDPELQPDRDATPGVRVSVGDPLIEAYGLMCAYLVHVGHFRLLPFGYDWRRSIDEIADQIYSRLPDGPFSVVAHSMGCLVTRRCVQRHPDVVDRIEHAVFMGPPFKGSFLPLRVLAGEEWLSQVFGLVSDVLPQDVLGTCPGFADLVPDPVAFAGSKDLLTDQAWAKTPLSDGLVGRALGFAGRLRQPQGQAQVDDGRLLEKASIVLASNRLTADRADKMENGGRRFANRGWGDSIVCVQSAWDNQAKAHYLATFPHPFLAQEPSVIEGVGTLLRTAGQDPGPLLPYAREPALTALLEQIPDETRFVLEALEATPAASEPAGFVQRVKDGRITNADLHWLLSRDVPRIVEAGRHRLVPRPSP